MKKETITTTVKTKRPITDSEMLHALKDSMGPIFEHFEEKLKDSDGQVLVMEVTAQEGKVKLSYGFRSIEEP